MAYSLARPGPNGGPQGGVAVLVPVGDEILDTWELVPACAVRVRVRRGTRTFCVTSVYFPPNENEAVLDQLVAAWEALPAEDLTDDKWILGDANLDVYHPLGADVELAGALRTAMARMGAPPH